MEETFIAVKNRRRRKQKVAETNPVSLQLTKIESCKLDLQESAFYADLLASLSQCNFTSIVSYGIGSPSSCPIARHQFALLLLLNNQYNVRECSLYDPAFSCLDKELILHYDLTLIFCNEEGKRRVREKTLFYMPHCGKLLYDNVLRANWSSIENVIVIGNRFSSYKERLTTKRFRAEAPCVEKLNELLEEIEIKNSFKYEDIFNDLAIHWTKELNLPPPPPEAQIDPECDEIVFATKTDY